MIVLSLFDGMSCGRIALQELGIPIEKYYASEVDKFAIQNTMANFPDTIQLGDVRNIVGRALGHVDMLIGGSPCQSFSFAGKRAGMSTAEKVEIYTLSRYLELKAAGVQFEGQSYLFWEYMRILTELRETNPDILFLLENVKMSKKWENVLSEAIGMTGVHINSAVVSAQTRKRIYWTNIRTRKETDFFSPKLFTDIPQPKERNIIISDILQDEIPAKYFLTPDRVKRLIACIGRARSMDKSTFPIGNTDYNNGIILKIEPYTRCIAMKKQSDSGTDKTERKTNHLKTTQTENLILQWPHGSNKGRLIREKSPTLTTSSWEHNNLLFTREIRQLNPDKESNRRQPYQQNRVYSVYGTSPALCSAHVGQAPIILTPDSTLRHFTPTECARLQTVPNWYKWIVSERQQYKLLGNGWTVEVIKHIFSFLADRFKQK